MNSKERFLAELNGLEVDHVPVFPLLINFAANRYGITYKEYATNGHALAEAQLFLFEKFAIDAITSCSDAFRISAALGGDMVYPTNLPPYLAKPLIEKPSDLKKFFRPDPTDTSNRMGDRVLATNEMVKAVGNNCAVLGWVDMPFAEACSLCSVENFLVMIMDDKKFAHKILEKVTDIVIDFSLAQINTGALMIGAGDAAASLISPELYREFALPYEQKVCEVIHKNGGLVKLHICGDTKHLLNDMVTTTADIFNVDYLVPLAIARDIYCASNKCFKGNINPVEMIDASPESVKKKIYSCLEIVKGCKYMVSAGCEIPLGITDDVMHAFCNASKSFRINKCASGRI